MEILNFNTIGRFCAHINLEDKKPVIDLRRIRWISPFALVYFGLFLRRHNNNGVYFDLIYPDAEKVRSFLERQNFNNRFNIVNRDIVTLDNINPIIYSFELVDVTKEEGLADRTVVKIANLLHKKNIRIPIEEFCMAVGELVDNFAIHSGDVQSGVMMLQLYPGKKSICFIIGDCGIGIRNSLIKNPKFNYLKSEPHEVAIKKAVESGVTRFNEERGYGFYEVIEIVSKLGGNFALVSYSGYLRFNGRNFFLGRMEYELPGVQVEFTLQEAK